MEYLDFESTNGLPEVQQRALTFQVSEEGNFAGFVIKMEGTQDSRNVENHMHYDQESIGSMHMHLNLKTKSFLEGFSAFLLSHDEPDGRKFAHKPYSV